MTVSTLIERWNAFRRGEPDEATGEITLNQRLFRLAWPSLVENLMQTMLGFVDLVFVGSLGPAAIAGVGLGIQVSFFLQVAFMGLAVGNTALVARAIGAGDKREAQRIAKQALIIAVLLSTGIAAIGFFFSDAIIRLMGAEPDVTAIGGNFLRVVSVFSIVMGVMVIGGGTLRGAGDTRTPMFITGMINGVNILLDYLLIFGNFGFPRLGTTGAAVATMSARAVGAALILYVLFKRGSVVKLAWNRGWTFRREVLARILNIGWPAAAEQIVFQLGFITFSMLALWLGTADLAAQQIAFNVSNISILPAFAFGVAGATLVGQSLGAKDPARAEASARAALKGGILWMSVMGVGFFFGRHFLVGLYTNDPTVAGLGEMCLIFISLTQPLQATWIVLSWACRGAGDTRATLLITFLSVWIARVAIGYFFGILLGLGLFGVWLGWLIDFVLRSILIVIRFRSGVWKKVKV